MTFVVCAKYCGSVIELDEFKTQDEAVAFTKNPFVLFYADEMENGEEDEIIYPKEMWIEEYLGVRKIVESYKPIEYSTEILPF